MTKQEALVRLSIALIAKATGDTIVIRNLIDTSEAIYNEIEKRCKQDDSPEESKD